MPARALSLIVGLLIANSAYAAETTSPPLANHELLHSARTWEARDRGDLAVLALNKLVATRPNSPEALLELGELHLRMGNITDANAVLTRLQTRFADAPATRTYAIEYRILTRDRLQLAAIERLIQLNRHQEAHVALRKLFGDGAPNGILGLDYYRLLARIPGHEAEAHSGLRALADRHPEDSRYQLGLAKSLLRQSRTAQAGMQLLSVLSERDDLRRTEVDDALASAFRAVGYGRVPLAVLRNYVARRPDDETAATALARRERRREASDLLSRDALAAIARPEQQRNFDAMANALEQQAAADPTAAHAWALLQLLQGQLPQGTPPLDDVTLLAALWEARARQAESQQRIELAAAEYEITLALRQRRYEAVIPLAEEIEVLGETEPSGELLAAASRLAPRSTWLFATHMRWLIAHDRADAALTALAARPLDDRWTVSERDALRARVLEQRARSRDAREPTQALADLVSALELAPTDPWIRYRLAQTYARRGEREAGRTLMSNGVRENPRSYEMRYAQALYLASIDDDANALTALEAIPDSLRSIGMRELHERLQVSLARARASELLLAGDMLAARNALLAAESLASKRFEAALDLAFSWISLGDTAHGLALVAPFITADADKDRLLGWATALDSAQEDEQLSDALTTLRSIEDLTAAERTRVAVLQRSLELRAIERLERDGDRAAASRALDALLTHSPDDRQLQVVRAELDLRMAQPQNARDRYATLVAEQPDDLDTRLGFVRSLTESGNLAVARVQLQAVKERLPTDDVELRLSIARRQSALGDHADAAATLDAVIAQAPQRSDVLLLAADVQRALGNYEGARSYLLRAEQTPDAEVARAARQDREAIDSRRHGKMTAATELRSKPGDAGVSQFESQLLTTTWRYPVSYTGELVLHADAVTLDAGKLGSDYDTAALFGALQSAGPTATRRFVNGRQVGLSLGTGYRTEMLALDVGTTPLGFTVNNAVGGIEWTPRWGDLDVSLRLARRAVTSSVLSYGGQRDPITGNNWGGVVATGPSITAGYYRDRYSISGSLKVTELTGTEVLDNRFIGLRGSTDWQFLNRASTQGYAGLTLNYWNYAKNLGGYTFGHGGYYSPQSYLSVALPIELQGRRGEWSYRLRASISQSVSQLDRSPFYPTDPALQAAAASSPLPAGFDTPFYEASNGSGFGVSAYAAIERQVFGGYVVGGVLDLDRSDFYKPTVVMLYVRHRFGPYPLTITVPPRPTRPYNDD